MENSTSNAIHALTRNIAIQKLTQLNELQVNATRIYSVDSSWMQQYLLGQDNVSVVRDSSALAEAVKDSDSYIIIVPADAALNKAMVERIASRVHLPKVIFVQEYIDQSS